MRGFKLHPLWDSEKVVNDLAVMELMDSLGTYSRTAAACLPDKNITGSDHRRHLADLPATEYFKLKRKGAKLYNLTFGA